MPKLSQTIETRGVAKIEPKLRKQIVQKLAEYVRLSTQAKALKVAVKELTEQIGKLRDETGEMSIGVDGFKITLVAGETSKINPKKLIALGCRPEWIEQATETKPKKSYNKITVPGDTDEDDEE